MVSYSRVASVLCRCSVARTYPSESVDFLVQLADFFKITHHTKSTNGRDEICGTQLFRSCDFQSSVALAANAVSLAPIDHGGYIRCGPAFVRGNFVSE